MPRILDSHIHMYAPEVAADPRAWGESHREPGWTRAVAPSERRSIQGWATVERLLADMDAAGVEKCVMLGWYWENQETCELQNDWHADWVRRHPDRLLAFAAVQPRAGQRALDALQRALDSGLCGVGEMLPQAQGFAGDDPWWHRVVEIAIARKVPVNVHVTDPVVVDPEIAPATPLEGLVNLARRFPEARFIFGHWGGGLPFHELNARVRETLGNVLYDTAASPLMYDPSIFRRVVDLVGAGRILFGSDYPLRLYPKDSREPDMRRFLAEVEASGLNEAEKAKVLGGNLVELLRIA